MPEVLPEPPVDPLIGTTIDRYEIKSELGRGGMGVVYLAHQIDLKRDVAIKVLMKGLDQSPKAVARFRREAEATHRIESPHIVKMYDFGRSQDLIYTAMELIDGETLGEVLARGRLPGAECIRIATEIATALVAAHTAGVVHRDLKPDNIMLCTGAQNQIKVLDFGIAKMLEPDPVGGISLTNTGALIGTPKYMSPEAANGAKAGAPADLYALGVILFEMLTGTPPFLGETLIMLLSQHCSEPPPSPVARDPELVISDALSALIARLLSKSGDERPTAQETLDLLRAMPNAASVSERSLSRPPSFERASISAQSRATTGDVTAPTSRGSRRGLAVAVIALLSVVGVAVASYALWSPSDDRGFATAPAITNEGTVDTTPASDRAGNAQAEATESVAVELAPGAAAEVAREETVIEAAASDVEEEAAPVAETARGDRRRARRRVRRRTRSADMNTTASTPSPETPMTSERPRTIGTVSEWR